MSDTAATASDEKNWDVLITGAKLFAGDGGLPREEDLAISGGKIVARGVGLDPAQACERVDAQGQWLMPGLLDLHTHLDLEVELDPGLPEVVRHGTTTVIMSNCSLGLAFGAQRRDGADPVVDCFARVENIPKPVLARVADRLDWDNTADYLRHFKRLALGPNVVPLIPHSMLRIEVMGLRDSVSRDPTEDELERMESLLEQAMEQGYAGFSTDALPFHFLANDPNRNRRIPTQFGSYAELRRLTDVLRRHDRVWQATPPKDSPLATLRNFLLTSGRLFGRPLKLTAVAALDVVSNRSILKLGKLLTAMLNSRLLKGHFRLQALAAPFKVYADGLLTPLAEEIPEMREMNEPDLEDREARLALLADPAYRERFKRMWFHDQRGWTLARLKRRFRRMDDTLTRDLDDMIMTDRPLPEWKDETLAQIYRRYDQWRTGQKAKTADEASVFARFEIPVEDEADFFLALLQVFDTDLRWYVLAANADPEVCRDTLKHPQMLPGFNDSGAHLTNMAFYDANLRGLQLMMEEGDAAVARHVRRLTREPARFFGLDVGLLEPGWPADCVLINPDALRSYDSERHTQLIYRDILGHEQMVNRSDGVVTGVWVAGERLWQGEFTEAFAQKTCGQVLTVGGAVPVEPLEQGRLAA